jgi:DNA-binding response OmpR family regulator
MRKKILVVEDNAQLLDVLRSYLKAAGFAIATATNGIEALKKVRSVAPDLVLLDLVLPELDGFAVYETLRRAPATASIPILIVSGLTSLVPRCAGLEAGPCEVLAKPVNPRLLVARIKELLRQARGSSSAPKGERSKSPEPAARMPARRVELGSRLEAEGRSCHCQGR